MVKNYSLNRNNRDRLHFKELYIDLNEKSRRYIEKGEMTEGTEYLIPRENGTSLIMGCHSKYATLSLVDKDGNRNTILDKDSSLRAEYGAIDIFSLDRTAGIGYKYPESFRKLICEDLKKGMIVTFDTTHKSATSYVCVDTKEGEIKLKKIHTDGIDRVSAKTFNETEIKTYRVSNDEVLQNLYNEVKQITGSVIPHMGDIDTSAQQLINSLYQKVQDKRTVVLEYGKETFTLKRKMFSKELSWYDKTGNQLKEDDVKAYIAWINNPPIQLDFSYTNKNEKQDIDLFTEECNVRLNYEKCLINNDYMAAIHMLTEASETYSQDFEITMHSIGKDFRDISFIFMPDKNGKCQIMKAEYDNLGRQNGEISKLSKITEAEFANFCKDRYDNCKVRLYDHAALTWEERRSKALPAGQKVIDQMIDKEVVQLTEALKRKDAFINEIREDIRNLAKTFADRNEIEKDDLEWSDLTDGCENAENKEL